MKEHFEKTFTSQELPKEGGYYFTEHGLLFFHAETKQWPLVGGTKRYDVTYWLKPVKRDWLLQELVQQAREIGTLKRRVWQAWALLGFVVGIVIYQYLITVYCK